MLVLIKAGCSPTRFARRHIAVLVLDEIEKKAHPDIYNVLLQVMDHATLTDNNGRKGRLPQHRAGDDDQRGRAGNSARHDGFGAAGPAKNLDKSAIERTFSPGFATGSMLGSRSSR